MAIDRWDPFRDLLSMRDAMDRFWREGYPATAASSGTWAPRMDVLEEPDQYRIRLSIPGVKPEDVQIQAEQNMLTVSGELRPESAPSGGRFLHQEHVAGSFSRSISLPGGIDTEQASAQFEHGVLTITLPKSEAARPRRIQIQTASAPAQRTIEGASSVPTQGEKLGEKGETQPAGMAGQNRQQ
jgi:HSP20 family protein